MHRYVFSVIVYKTLIRLDLERIFQTSPPLPATLSAKIQRFTPFRVFFYTSLSDYKSPQVSRTLLSIQANLSAVVWIVSSRPLISKSFRPCANPLVTAPRRPITSSTTVTFMLHSFFNSLKGRGTYLSFHFLSILLCGLSRQEVSFRQVLFLLNITRFSGLAEIYHYYYFTLLRVFFYTCVRRWFLTGV